MNKKDELKFAAIMAALEVVFNREVTKEQINLYYNFLNDLSIGQIERAVEWIIETQSRFPSISEIRTATLESLDIKAFNAWSEILKAGGKYSTMPKFEDPIIAKVINKAFGGWENFCWYKLPSEFSLNQDRKHFILAYKLFHNEVERKSLFAKKEVKRLS